MELTHFASKGKEKEKEKHKKLHKPYSRPHFSHKADKNYFQEINGASNVVKDTVLRGRPACGSVPVLATYPLALWVTRVNGTQHGKPSTYRHIYSAFHVGESQGL